MRYIIGFLISIGLIILLFVMIFRGGDEPTDPNATRKLVDYANTTTVVRLVDDYPVTADQTHRQVVITVGRDSAVFTSERGYEGDVIRTQTYANNPASYANFLRALQVSGFIKGDNNPELRDERGYCPTGHRYIYEIKDGSRSISRFWSTSCGNIGSFKGKADTIRILFHKQIPDYNQFTTTSQLQ